MITDRKTFYQFLVHTLALLKLGRLMGVSVSVISADGREECGAYLAPGVNKLLLLKQQIDLLTSEVPNDEPTH